MYDQLTREREREREESLHGVKVGEASAVRSFRSKNVLRMF